MYSIPEIIADAKRIPDGIIVIDFELPQDKDPLKFKEFAEFIEQSYAKRQSVCNNDRFTYTTTIQRD